MLVYIAEKPAVAKVLVDYFNRHGAHYERAIEGVYTERDDAYCITWTLGHIMYLVNPQDYDEKYKSWDVSLLPIVPNNYYFIKRPKKEYIKQYNVIKGLCQDATTIVHVGDPDREGQVLVDELIEGEIATVKRLMLPALDDLSIARSLFKLEDNSTYKGLSEAGLARSYIDWLIGINLTRYFTTKAKDGGFTNVMKVGRVKAPTLKLIVDRYKAYIHHQEVVTYQPVVQFVWQEETYEASLDETYTTEEEAIAAIHDVLHKEAIITEIISEQKKETVKELYSLDTLQVDANRFYGFTPSNVLSATQTLYEKKYVSYPRSDCKYLPESQYKDHELILDALAPVYPLPVPIRDIEERTMPPVYNDEKITAHHAIVPTKTTPDLSTLGDFEKNIYFLILKKYVSIFMDPYTYTMHKITLTLPNQKEATLTVKELEDPGHHLLYVPEEKTRAKYLPDNEPLEKEEYKTSFTFQKDKKVSIIKTYAKKKVTKPKPLFTQGTLIQAMNNIKTKDESLRKIMKEVKGIGTPATRANIIEELLKEKFIMTDSKNKIIPTQTGISLCEILPEQLTKADFTAKLEMQFDEIAKGNLTKEAVLDETVAFIKEALKTPVNLINTQWPCPICKKGHLHEKRYKENDKYISYYRCNQCNQTISSNKEQTAPFIVHCPDCKKGVLVSKKNKEKGTVFYACTEYPSCKKTCTEEAFYKMKGDKK